MHTDKAQFSLMIHGGTVAPERVLADREQTHCLEGMRVVLEHGRELLCRGGSALDAVEACTALLEDDPQFNAGRGSVLNELGRFELDAAIMDGRDLGAGAVAAVHGIANPVRLARLVLARSGHVLLAGEGALRFARQCGMPTVPDAYFLTAERLGQFEAARHRRAAVAQVLAGTPEHGTVGAVARDLQGNLAAATSTGGVVCKRAGRIGDSPIIGAGVFADNASAAISATGRGEDFMRTVLAKTIAARLEAGTCDAARAARAGIDYLVNKVNGEGGVIVIDTAGNCASCFNTGRMIHGWIEHAGETRCTLTEACGHTTG